MFTRPLPLAGESSYEGLSKLVINGMLTAGVAVTQHVIEGYLARHLNTPAVVGYPALNHRRRGQFTTTVTFKRHHHGLDDKEFLKIALPASTTIKHACSASYVFQPPSTKASMVGIALCVAVAIITASAVFLNSNRRGVSATGASTSSTSSSNSEALSNRGSSSLQARRGRVMLVTGSGGSGGSDPVRGRDLGRRSSSLSRTHQPSPLRQTLATAESGSPPPPPPPHFPPPAEDKDDDDDENPTGSSGFWISILLLIPVFLKLKKLLLLSPARGSGSGAEAKRSVVLAGADVGFASGESVADTASTGDLTCGNILPLPSPVAVKVLPKPKPNPTSKDDAAYACQNVLPLTTHRSSSTLVRSQDHPTHLPGLSVNEPSIHGTKNVVEATWASRLLRLLSALVYMVGAFVLPLVPLMLFRAAVREPEATEPVEQSIIGSVDGESSEEGEVYDMVLERPEVRPVEDQVLARIAMHFRPLRDDDFMDSESESEDVLETPHRPTKMQTPTPSDSPVKTPAVKLPPTTPNALNPQASTFVPKRSRATHDERLAKWKASLRTGESSSSINSNPPPARTPGPSLASTDSVGGEGKSRLTPNQKSSLRRKMRKKGQMERDCSQGGVVVLGSGSVA